MFLLENSTFSGVLRRLRPQAKPRTLKDATPEERRLVVLAIQNLIEASDRYERERTAPKHRVIEALERLGRPVTNNELAAALGLSPSRTTRLRAEVADKLRVERRGRQVFISLRY